MRSPHTFSEPRIEHLGSRTRRLPRRHRQSAGSQEKGNSSRPAGLQSLRKVSRGPNHDFKYIYLDRLSHGEKHGASNILGFDIIRGRRHLQTFDLCIGQKIAFL